LNHFEWRWPPDAPILRAEKALARLLPDAPPWRVRQAFARRDVKINGRRAQPSVFVRPGDAIEVFMPGEAPAPIEVVLQDDDFLIAVKPQGLPVQPDAGGDSLEVRTAAAIGAPVFACHRLDVQTGGLVLLARHDEALSRAKAAFAAHRVRKTYQALVRGVPSPREARLFAYLRKDAAKARVDVFERPTPGALPIETGYRVIGAVEGLSHLEIELFTGRTHQIRAHLAHIGHPVLGDDKYGDRALNRAHHAQRQQLWATRLVLWDGRTVTCAPQFIKEIAKDDSTDRL
jgi:23S rRNA pseudouridine955/2504/2580 synthase